MAIIDSIKDKLGNIIYPKTLTKAIYEEGTNKRLDNILNELVDTDTTYTEITEEEINTGTASTLRTITARRVTYIANKIVSALTKSDVGLGNVDNTSDVDKPVSTATQTALNGKRNTNHAFTWNDLRGM